MKFVYGALVALIVTAGSGLLAQARTWGTETHGGDGVAEDFIRYGRNIESLFPFLRTKLLTASQIAQLTAAIDGASISSQETISKDGLDLDALNDPSAHTIVVSRHRWLSSGTDFNSMHGALALHEYLWLSGVDDTNYHVSLPLLADLDNARHLRSKSPISAGLRKTLCSAIITRDHQTIDDSLEMGADLDGPCGSVDYKCPEGSEDQNVGHGFDDSQSIMDGPVAMAIRNMGDQNFCHFPAGKDPDSDQEMIGILKSLLVYHPELKRTKARDSVTSFAANIGNNGVIRLLVEAGADPFSGLISVTNWGNTTYYIPEDELEEYISLGADVNSELPVEIGTGEVPYIFSARLLSDRSTPAAFIDFLVTNHKIDFCKSTRGSSAYESRKVGGLIAPNLLQIAKKYSDRCIP